MAWAFSIGIPSFRCSAPIVGLPESCRLEQTWRVWDVSVIWIRLNRIPDHNSAESERRRGRRRVRGFVTALLAHTCVAKSPFRKRLRGAKWISFRPADLARGHSSPPPEVSRKMALVRKTSRQGYLR